VNLVLGTHFYQGDPDAMRRQSCAADALQSLSDVIAIDVQWHDTPAMRPWIRTVAALRRDSTTVTGRAGRVKPVVSDILDALAAVAERERCRYFAYMNSDIIVSPAAVALIAAGGCQAYAFSRMDYDSTGRDTGLILTGCDAFAFDVAWWRANRHRFRPYILGEPCWDNVYASLLMCHGTGMLVNRDAAIRHEIHGTAWGAGAFSEYNGFLAALDSRYFTLWATYHALLTEARARRASEAEERAIAARVFVWRRSPALALKQAARDVKAHVRYRRQRARWPAAN
jgi:hypothetical protein